MSCKCGISGKKSLDDDLFVGDHSKQDAFDKEIEKKLIFSHLKFR